MITTHPQPWGWAQSLVSWPSSSSAPGWHRCQRSWSLLHGSSPPCLEGWDDGAWRTRTCCCGSGWPLTLRKGKKKQRNYSLNYSKGTVQDVNTSETEMKGKGVWTLSSSFPVWNKAPGFKSYTTAPIHYSNDKAVLFVTNFSITLNQNKKATT